jgi:integrase
VKLTDKRILSLKPRIYRYTMHDTGGLYIEVWPSGIKSWRLRFMRNRVRQRVTLGRFPEVTISMARADRDQLMQAICAGRSPHEERRRQRQEVQRSLTVKEFGERYLREVVGRARKDSTPVRRYLDRSVYPVMGGMRIAAVDAGHVRDLVFAIRDAGHGQAAAAVRNLLKRVWDYALACGIVTDNPARATPIKYIAAAKARSRALSEAEIKECLNRLDASSMRDDWKAALRLILLTLVRKSELRLARWEHIDLVRGEWEIPLEHSKTGMGQIVYLSRQAKELIQRLATPAKRSGHLFPASGSDGSTPIGQTTLNRALKQIQRGMAHFTVHDLRRTGATRLSEMGYNADWIEKALNHKLRGVRGIYNRAEYGAQRREMLQAWADTLDTLQSDERAA